MTANLGTPERPEPLIEVNELEMILGGLVGVMRAAAALTLGRVNRAHGIDDDGRIWTRHVEGAIAEVAAAKCLDRFWAGAAGDDYRRTKPAGGDVGRLQVRMRIASCLDQQKRLIIQERDADADDFLLLVGRAPSYRAVGWFNAGEAKQHPEWIQNPGSYGPAWFVPQANLHAVRYLEAAAA